MHLSCKKIILTLLFICLSSAVHVHGQNESSITWEAFVEELMEDDNEETEDIDTELFEALEELHNTPLNINNATKEELTFLPFISDEQADDILHYIDRNGVMASLGELMYVSSLDKCTREKLRLFVYAGDMKNSAAMPSAKELAKHIRGEAMYRTDIPFYNKAGNLQYPDSVLLENPNKAYIGDKYHHSFRASVSSMDKVFAGVQLEKDAGEYGLDHFAGYLMVKDWGIVKRAVVGNYRASFGQGLAVNTSMKLGKMMMLGKTSQMDAGFTKHSSTAEYGYLQGAAATIGLGQFDVSAFVSYRKADGSFRNDSLGLTSLKTDGLHRTQLERSKHNNISITDLGANIHWERDNVRLSATLAHTHLNTPLMPEHNTDASLYRFYNAHGKDFTTGSVAYSWRHKRILFTGESAVSHANGIVNPETGKKEGKQNGFATINTLNWRIDGSNTLTAIGRWYGSKYVCLNGKAFGENALPQNEEGVFVGWTSRSISNLNIQAYVDFMYFPWMKYKVSSSSYGVEAMAQAEYTFSPTVSLLARYRMKTKERDYEYYADGYEHMDLRWKTNHNMKMQLNWKVSDFVTLRTQATGVVVQFGGDAEKGFAISENMRWQNARKVMIDCGLTYFDTNSYDSRISTYEPTLLYAFGFMSHFYNGIRGTLLASVPVYKQKLFITGKLGTTIYLDRYKIGTGTEQINAPFRQDLQLQLIYKL